MVIQYLNLWATAILFSTVAVPFHMPINKHTGPPISPHLASANFFYRSHPKGCDVLSHCPLDLLKYEFSSRILIVKYKDKIQFSFSKFYSKLEEINCKFSSSVSLYVDCYLSKTRRKLLNGPQNRHGWCIMCDQELVRLRFKFSLTPRFHATHILIGTNFLDRAKYFSSCLFSISFLPGIMVGPGDIKMSKTTPSPLQQHYEVGKILPTLHLRNYRLLRSWHLG